jgi:hypothetical protein
MLHLSGSSEYLKKRQSFDIVNSIMTITVVKEVSHKDCCGSQHNGLCRVQLRSTSSWEQHIELPLLLLLNGVGVFSVTIKALVPLKPVTGFYDSYLII